MSTNVSTEDLVRDLLVTMIGDEQQDIFHVVGVMTADEVIIGHNMLKVIDEELKKRWLFLGSPEPERLQ